MEKLALLGGKPYVETQADESLFKWPIFTDEDINAEYESLASQYQLELDKVKGMVPAEEITASLKVRKSIKVIVDNAVAVAPKTEE